MYKIVVKGVRDLGVIKGATGPHLVECDDGKKYVVKFADRSKTAVNEFVGHELARAVGLPVAPGSLVELGPGVIAGSSDLINRGIRPGLHPASELIDGVMDMSQFGRRRAREGIELSNPEALPGSICHDNWVLTSDRERSDNHLVQPVGGRFLYLMVDFTHGFTGPSWTADSIEQGSYLRLLMPTHHAVAEVVTGPGSFSPTLERIEALPDSEIERILAAVPSSWGVSDEERLCLTNFLELRRGLIRGVLSSSRAAFPNWKR